MAPRNQLGRNPSNHYKKDGTQSNNANSLPQGYYSPKTHQLINRNPNMRNNSNSYNSSHNMNSYNNKRAPPQSKFLDNKNRSHRPSGIVNRNYSKTDPYRNQTHNKLKMKPFGNPLQMTVQGNSPHKQLSSRNKGNDKFIYF